MAMKTFQFRTFTFDAASTSDTLPMVPCPICHELFNAGDEAVAVETSKDGEYDDTELFHAKCFKAQHDFGARG